MPRSGITRVMVDDAHKALIARGEKPTIDAIRIELGNTGSKTTISRYLKEISESESIQLADEALLTEGLKDIVIRLAKKLRLEAEAIVDQAQKSHQEQLNELQSRLSEVETHLKEKESDLNAVRNKLEIESARSTEAEDKLVELEAQLREQTQALSDSAQRLQDKDSHIQSLEDKYQRVQSSLEHFRESSRLQRDKEQRHQAEQVQQFQLEARQQAQVMIAKQNELTEVSKDNARLAAELRQSHQDSASSKELIRSLEASLQKQQTGYDTLKNQLLESDGLRRKDAEVLATLKRQYEKKSDGLAVANQRVIQLEAQALTQESLFNQLSESMKQLAGIAESIPDS